MVKINYCWNAEMPNPGRHADNDREFEKPRKSKRGRESEKERGERASERLGTVPGEAQLPLID